MSAININNDFKINIVRLDIADTAEATPNWEDGRGGDTIPWVLETYYLVNPDKEKLDKLISVMKNRRGMLVGSEEGYIIDELDLAYLDDETGMKYHLEEWGALDNYIAKNFQTISIKKIEIPW